MIHNKYGFKPGDIVVLDERYHNWNKVKIVSFTPNQMFATVHSVEETEKDSWETMTNRLSPIKY